MPGIFKYLELVFFFYANEHLSIHVHASFGECEDKILLNYKNGK